MRVEPCWVVIPKRGKRIRRDSHAMYVFQSREKAKWYAHDKDRIVRAEIQYDEGSPGLERIEIDGKLVLRRERR